MLNSSCHAASVSRTAAVGHFLLVIRSSRLVLLFSCAPCRAGASHALVQQHPPGRCAIRPSVTAAATRGASRVAFATSSNRAPASRGVSAGIGQGRGVSSAAPASPTQEREMQTGMEQHLVTQRRELEAVTDRAGGCDGHCLMQRAGGCVRQCLATVLGDGGSRWRNQMGTTPTGADTITNLFPLPAWQEMADFSSPGDGRWIL